MELPASLVHLLACYFGSYKTSVRTSALVRGRCSSYCYYFLISRWFLVLLCEDQNFWTISCSIEYGVSPRLSFLGPGASVDDLARMQCSEEVVVLGIMRVVEELQTRHPTSHIVLNSLFPMSRIRGTRYPTRSDWKDSVPTATTTNEENDPRAPPPGGVRHGRQLLPAEAEAPQQHSWENMSRRRRARKRRRRRRRSDDSSEDEDGRPAQPLSEAAAANAEDERYERRQKRPRRGWFGRRPPPPPQKVVDPRLEETHHVRKHVADVKLPLWTSVLVVNRQLKKFAEKHSDCVSFFDATSIFTEVDAAGRTILQTDLISITGHPTKRGFDVWEEHVAQFALDTLVQLKKTTPELFPNNNNKNTNTGGDGAGEGGVDDYFLYQDDVLPSLNQVLSPDQLAQQDPAIEDDIYSKETDDFPSLPMTPHTDDA